MQANLEARKSQYDSNTTEYFIRHQDRTRRLEREEDQQKEDKNPEGRDVPTGVGIDQDAFGPEDAADPSANKLDDGSVKEIEDRLALN